MQSPAPPLRILARCHVLRPGGAPNLLLSVLRALARRHRVTLLLLDTADQEFVAVNRSAGLRFADQVAAQDYDVVLANTLFSAQMVVQCAGVLPTVWWIHEAAIGKTFIEEGKIDTAAFELATRIVFPGPRQPLDVYAPWLEGRSWSVIPSAVRPREGIARKRSEDGRFRIVQVGAVSSLKGQDYTHGALRKLNDEAIELHIVGADYSAWAQKLKKMVDGIAELSGRTVWLGELSQDASLQEIADADLLVFPRRATSFPLAVQEAMALSVPVICAACPAVTELLTDGETALLVPDDDRHALAAAIRRVKTEPGLAKRLAANAKAHLAASRPYEGFVAGMEAELYQAVDTFQRRGG